VKITVAKDKPNFKSTVGWLLTEISACEIWGEGPPIEDDPSSPESTKERGVVIHWNESNKTGEQVLNYFQMSGYIVRISHQLPLDSPSSLLWMDVGPGSPFHNEIVNNTGKAAK